MPKRWGATALAFTALGAFVFAAGPPARAAGVHLASSTLVRAFEDRDGNRATPVYEYLQADLGELDDRGVSVHLYGWGRLDLADDDAFGDRAAGEAVYAYAQYTAGNNLMVRLGRQYVFQGGANESLDGVRVDADVSPLFSFTAYGGVPVAVEEVDGRSGDTLWGGRFGHHSGDRYDLGLSYKHLANDGSRDDEFVGLDGSVSLPAGIGVSGRSLYSLATDGWAEHAYEADVPAWGTRIRPFFQQVSYEDRFDTGENTGGPFRALAGSDERSTTLGADWWIPAAGPVDVTVRLHHNRYDERSSATYAAGSVRWPVAKALDLGGELGRMNGGDDRDRYTLLRLFAYWELPFGYATADAVYARYDEDVFGEDASLFLSATGGWRTPVENLLVEVNADYGSDPYFDSNLRAFAAVRYVYDR